LGVEPLGVTRSTLYRWKKRFEEDRRPKRMYLQLPEALEAPGREDPLGVPDGEPQGGGLI